MNFSKKSRQKLNESQSLRYLTRAWSFFNIKRFNGLMDLHKISLVDKPNIMGAYKAIVKNEKVISSEIFISRKVFLYSSKKIFINTLLHEMTHQYVAEILKKPHGGHDKTWKMACKISGATPLTKERFIYPSISLKKYLKITRFAQKTSGGTLKMVQWYHLDKQQWISGLCVRKQANNWLFICLSNREIKWYLLDNKFLFKTKNFKNKQKLLKVIKNWHLETD